jgi:hypothetical protein
LTCHIFRREIQISIEIIFAAINFYNIKDDYSEKFVEILKKVQSGQYGSTFLSVL